MQRALVLLSMFAVTSCRDAASSCGPEGCADALGAGGRAGAGGADGVGEGGLGGGGTDAGRAGRESVSGAPGSAGDGGDDTQGAGQGGGGGEGGDAGGGGATTQSECGPCPSGLHCEEEGADGASCVYPNPGRWLAFTGNDTGGEPPFELRALRLEGAKPSPSLLLSQGALGEHFHGDSWSPDGRHLIGFGLSFDDLGTNTLLHVEFGDGLPSAQAPLPGLPVVGGSLMSPVWASDSSRLFIQNVRPTPELYLVHLTGKEIHTELLFRNEEAYDLAFCENPRWFIRGINGDIGPGETRLVDSEHPMEEQTLWPGVTYASPDGHFLIGADWDTGLWRATCEADTRVVRLSDRSASEFEWSADSRFVVMSYDDEENEIVAIDASNDFQMVFSAYPSEHAWPWSYRWSPGAPRLVVFGASEPGGACEVLDAEMTTTPPEVARRGSCPETGLGGSWGVLRNGAIWAWTEASDASRELFLLEPGEDVWRPIAAGLSNTSPEFTPDESYVVFNHHLDDGTVQVLAFSLSEPEPTAIPLQPAPAPYLNVRFFHAGGVILHGGDTDEQPYSGQLWWAPLGPSRFGPAVPLADVALVSDPRLQPER